MSEQLWDGRELCVMCGDGFGSGRATPADTTIAAPADTGPFTNVEESTDFKPTNRWDMPVCKEHYTALSRIVACANCQRPLPLIDAITNGEDWTVALCRPCNAEESNG